MNFSDLIKIRQSDRKYLDQPIEPEKTLACLEAARLAPSATNAQPWRFIAVDKPELRAELGNCAASLGMNKFVAQAPLIVVVVMEKPNLMSKIGSVLQDKEYTLLDVGIAASHLCLQAADLGLGSCMIGWFDEKKVKKLLGVEKNRRVPLLITLGYPASPTRAKTRKEFDAVCAWNAYK